MGTDPCRKAFPEQFFYMPGYENDLWQKDLFP